MSREWGSLRAQRWGSGGDGDELSLTLDPLTARQCEILTRLGRGEPLRTIALALHISENTAATHCKRAYAKLGLPAERRNVLGGIDAHRRLHDLLCRPDVTEPVTSG